MKTKKSRILLSGVSVLLVLSLLVGGTMAWFTDTEKVDANFSAGVLDIGVKPGTSTKATLEFENLRPLTLGQFNAELVQEDLSNRNQEGFSPVPVYFQPVTITNNGTLPAYIQITAESLPDGFTCPKGGEKNVDSDNDGKAGTCTNGLKDKLKIFVYAKNGSGIWTRVENVNLNKDSLEDGEADKFIPSKENFLAAMNGSVTYVIGGHLPQDVDNAYQGKHFHGNVVVNAYQTDEGAGVNPSEDPDTVRNTIKIHFKENTNLIDEQDYTFTANKSDTQFELHTTDLQGIAPKDYKIIGMEDVRSTAANSDGLSMTIPLKDGKLVDDAYRNITVFVEKIGTATYAYTIQHMINGTGTLLDTTTGSASVGNMTYTPSNIEKGGKTYKPVQEIYTYDVSDAPGAKNVFQAYYEEVKNPVDVSIQIEYKVQGGTSAVGHHSYALTMEDGQTLTLNTTMDEVKNNIPTDKKYVFDGEPQEQVVTYPGSFTGTTVEDVPQATVTFLVKEEAEDPLKVDIPVFVGAKPLEGVGKLKISQSLYDYVKRENGTKVLRYADSTDLTLPTLPDGYHFVALKTTRLYFYWKDGKVCTDSEMIVEPTTVRAAIDTNQLSGPAKAAVLSAVNVANVAQVSAEPEIYAIYEQSELEAIDNHLSSKVYLMENISLTGNWTPPGWSSGLNDRPYTAIFDGRNKTISNLNVSGGSSYAGGGLFAYNKGTIKNLNLTNANVRIGAVAGIIAGQNTGTIENCHVQGAVTTTSYTLANLSAGGSDYVGSFTGGIVGISGNGGKILKSSADVEINNTYKTYQGSNAISGCLGGIAGMNYAGTVEECWAEAAINRSSYQGSNICANWYFAGALVGHNDNGSVVRNSWGYAKPVCAYAYVGGLVGMNRDSTISSCYGRISGWTIGSGMGNTAGDCIGYNNSGTINNAYYAYAKSSGDGTRVDTLTDGTVLNGFDQSVWNFASGAYPVLKNNL